MQVGERVDLRKMNCNEGIQHCDATALAALHHDRTVGSERSIRVLFGKANVLRLFNSVERIHEHFNPLQPSGHYMYHQFNIHKFYVLPTHCICVFCVDLRTNSDYLTIQH
jgi:hypothetical protein